MAKNETVTTETATQPEGQVTETGAATTTEAAAAAPKKDSRYIELTLKDGSKMKRKDFILKRWGEKASRGEIAKELTELEGREVPYQIVFQATKGVAGGPDPKPAAAPAAEAPAAEGGDVVAGA